MTIRYLQQVTFDKFFIYLRKKGLSTSVVSKRLSKETVHVTLWMSNKTKAYTKFSKIIKQQCY